MNWSLWSKLQIKLLKEGESVDTLTHQRGDKKRNVSSLSGWESRKRSATFDHRLNHKKWNLCPNCMFCDHIGPASLSEPLFCDGPQSLDVINEGGSLTFRSIHCRDRIAAAHSEGWALILIKQSSDNAMPRYTLLPLPPTSPKHTHTPLHTHSPTGTTKVQELNFVSVPETKFGIITKKEWKRVGSFTQNKRANKSLY